MKIKFPSNFADLIKDSIPTPEESKRNSLDWWSNLSGINNLELPKCLRNYMYTQFFAKISDEVFDNLEKDENFPLAIKALSKDIEPYFNSVKFFYDTGAFVKLISRSPKDISDGKPFMNSVEAAEHIINSMRCFEDLVYLSYIRHYAYVIIMPFVEINPLYEFRCFVKNRKLSAISRYAYNLNAPLYTKKEKELVISSASMIADLANQYLSKDSYVFDIVIHPKNNSFNLIELNPYGLSDPCLLTYEEIGNQKDLLVI